jgi:hypothetical protein
MADGDGETAAAHGSLLDLLGEEPAAAASTGSPGEISFGGSPDVDQQRSARQQQLEYATDPFAAFDFGFAAAAEPAAADACSSQEQHQQHQQQQEHTKVVHHQQQQQQGEAGPSDSLPKGDQAHATGGVSAGQDGTAAAAERASRLAHILQQHSQNQGQSTAKIR